MNGNKLIMSDRELLELAAKAAGVAGFYVEDKDWYGTGILFTDENDCNQMWNPLTDDGDALRLEVATNITTKHRFLEILAEENTLCNGDYWKARRRAIVRAAAEIGKEMK